MIRLILEPLLQRFGAATVHSAPTRYEIVLGHVAYLVGLGLLLAGAARVRGQAPPTSIGGLLTTCGLSAAFGFLFLYWAVAHRRVPPDLWFVSHLVWISLTYSLFFAWVIALFLALMVGLLFALAIPPIAIAVVYGPFIVGGLVTLWFTLRVLRGYVAYARRAPVGLGLQHWRGRTSGGAGPDSSLR